MAPRGAKRRLAFPSTWGMKKRRTVRRRNFRRSGKRTTTMSARQLNASNIPFRNKRRIPLRKYRALLYRSTMFKSHYQSIRSNAVNSASTLLPIGRMRIFSGEAFNSASGGFWTIVGGAIPNDLNEAGPPSFGDSIIIRGGEIFLQWGLSANSPDKVAIKVWLVKTVKGFVTGVGSAEEQIVVATGAPVGYDISQTQDFYDNVGKVVLRKQYIANPGDGLKVTYKLRCHKIDQHAHLRDQNSYRWYIGIWQLNDSDALVEGTSFYTGYSLSFSGDEVVGAI